MSDAKIYLINHKKAEYELQDHIVGYTESLTLPTRFYKIGIATDVERRLSALNGGTPHKLEVLTTLEADDPEAVEQHLHRLYRLKRVSGEWFKLTSNDIHSLEGLDRLSAGEVKHVIDSKGRGPLETSLYVEVMNYRQEPQWRATHA